MPDDAALSLHDLFARAVERQQQLDFAAAEAGYAQVLARFGAVGPAVYNLFTVLLSQDKTAEARALVASHGAALGGDLTLYDGIVADVEAALRPRPAYEGTVVIPAFNAAEYIGRALDSIVAAIRLLQREHGEGRRVAIVVADDASTDGTVAACKDWAAERSFADLDVVALARNGGPAAARNAGVKLSRGELLWFLDADDEFMPEHIATTWRILRDRPDCGFVRTRHYFETIHDSVTEAMRESNMLTSTINLCIRRSVHDFLGGMPECAAYRVGGGEDAAYSELMFAFFWGAICRRETVVYRRRPGNSLDRQAQRFTEGDGPVNNRPHDAETAAQLAGQAFTNHRAAQIARRLQDSHRLAGLPPLRDARWPKQCYRVD